MRALPMVLLAMVGCTTTSTAVPPARFANRPAVVVVNDRRNVPTRPEMRRFVRLLWFFDAAITSPLDRKLSLPRAKRAQGVNALDEVPDSTWFTNRIGVRDVSVAEIRSAPGETVGSPQPYLPFTIESTKGRGFAPGFIVRDTRGERWLIKFDRRGRAEAETGAQMISGKLLWAAGYNTTEDYIISLRREDLVIGPGALRRDQYGGPKHLNEQSIDERLALVEHDANGRFRTMASHMLSGEPIGGHPTTGVRADDPNDLIPHERRRDLRGARAMFSWLDHQDIQEGNTLDMWVTDKANPERHYVKHYFIDYGKTLGVMSLAERNLRRGDEYYIDPSAMAYSLVSLGLAERPWEGRDIRPYRGVGAFDARTFNPVHWVPGEAGYMPILVADDNDNFWGAKIVMRFTRPQIEAAVETAQFSDPRASKYIVDTLIGRQRALGRAWFDRVAPLDEFTYESDQLCFKDLAVEYKYQHAAPLPMYRLTSYDHRGIQLTASVGASSSESGRACTHVPLVGFGDGYTIVEIGIARPKFKGTVYVHLATDPRTHKPRVIGVYRP